MKEKIIFLKTLGKQTISNLIYSKLIIGILSTNSSVTKFGSSLCIKMNLIADYKEGKKLASDCGFCETRTSSTVTYVTLSLCEGLEEVGNVLLLVCDECGNMGLIPHQSVFPIQQAMKRLVESGVVTDRGDIPVKLKSKVDEKKIS